MTARFTISTDGTSSARHERQLNYSTSRKMLFYPFSYLLVFLPVSVRSLPPGGCWRTRPDPPALDCTLGHSTAQPHRQDCPFTFEHPCRCLPCVERDNQLCLGEPHLSTRRRQLRPRSDAPPSSSASSVRRHTLDSTVEHRTKALDHVHLWRVERIVPGRLQPPGRPSLCPPSIHRLRPAHLPHPAPSRLFERATLVQGQRFNSCGTEDRSIQGAGGRGREGRRRRRRRWQKDGLLRRSPIVTSVAVQHLSLSVISLCLFLVFKHEPRTTFFLSREFWSLWESGPVQGSYDGRENPKLRSIRCLGQSIDAEGPVSSGSLQTASPPKV